MAAPATPWIATVPPAEATGLLKEAYDWQAERLGEPTEFTMLGSLYPEIVMERLRLYRAVEGCPSALTAQERQLAAYVTSTVNCTPHCSSGLRVKLSELGVDMALLDIIAAAPSAPPPLGRRVDAILRYAAALALDAAGVTAAHVDELRAAGLSDLDILDLNNLVAYYCYINRVANGLGLHTPIPSEHALAAMPVTDR